MTDTVITAAAALKIVDRARKAGMKEGAILDAIGVSDSAVWGWQTWPDRVPHHRVRTALAALADKLDRAERRKGAR